MNKRKTAMEREPRRRSRAPRSRVPRAPRRRGRCNWHSIWLVRLLVDPLRPRLAWSLDARQLLAVLTAEPAALAALVTSREGKVGELEVRKGGGQRGVVSRGSQRVWRTESERKLPPGPARFSMRSPPGRITFARGLRVAGTTSAGTWR